MKQHQSKFRRWYPAFCLILLVLLAACTPVIRPADAQSTPEDNMAVANVRQVLTQQLHADATAVDVVAAVKEEWPDACLGAGRANESCAQVQTPGYQITLAVDGKEYRYHTNADGSEFRLVEAPAPAIGTRVLTWTDDSERGCQTLEAGTDGVAFGPCFGPLLGAPYSFDTRQTDLLAFADEYQSFTAATVAGTVDFVGNGDKIASAAEQRMIAEWARLVALEAQGGRSGASWGLVFAWRREGGIAGFCDDVTVYVSGDAYVTSCKGNEPQDLGRLRLSSNQLQVVYDWVDTLQPFEVEQSDPATADAMTTRIVFSGAGNAAADEATYRAISDLALALIFQATTTTPATNPDVTNPEPLPIPAASAVISTAVQLIQANVNVNIRSGPGTNFGIVGKVFAGQSAQVTGVMPDQSWWRVICPDGSVGSCFVVNDPSFVQPSTTVTDNSGGNATDNPPVTTPITDTGEAMIESVEVRILASDPVQIEAVIRGQLPDACSFIQDTSVAVEGNVFNIRLTTARQLAQRCIQVLTPFEQVVRLGSPEPATGSYEVRVGEVVESFTLGE
ncbi:MAG: SH3 domain-containing protein [Caldilinea sp. CFX5]|nr:SH3 domain-containing protein [Caldilinea sp. CFX5]